MHPRGELVAVALGHLPRGRKVQRDYFDLSPLDL
jgi:hypothetical protein